jgi:hypothetical protein
MELFTLICGMAAASWCVGAHSVFSAFRTLPQGEADMPFFSNDPAQISQTGRVYRRRIYISAMVFTMSMLLMWAVRG